MVCAKGVAPEYLSGHLKAVGGRANDMHVQDRLHVALEVRIELGDVQRGRYLVRRRQS